MSVDLTKGATVELVKTLSDDIRTKADGSVANSAGAAIREQFTDLKTETAKGLSQKEETYGNWVQGNVYIGSDNVVVFPDVTTRCRLINQYLMHGIVRVECNDGYQVSVAVAEYVNGTWGSGVIGLPLAKSVNVSEYVDTYLTFFGVRKTDDSDITPAEAIANVKFYSAVSEIKGIGELAEENREAIDRYIETARADYEIQDGKMYHNGTNSVISVADGHLLKATISQGETYYFSTSGYTSGGGFFYVNYFNSSNQFIGYEYAMTPNGQTETYDRVNLTIPENASWIYINGRGATPELFYATESSATLPDVAEELGEISNTVQTIKPFVLSGESEYTSEQENKLYYYLNQSVIDSTGGYLKKVEIESGKTYLFTSSATLGSNGFAFINYFDSNDSYISSEYNIPAGVETSYEKQPINPPPSASWFYVQGRNAEPIVFEDGVTPTKTLPQVIDELEELKTTQVKKEISILFVGNSLTQDGIAYLPYLLLNYYPEVNFKFYMWYNGGYTLAQQYQKFINDEPCDQFSFAENVARWTTTAKKMSEIVTTYKFDVVCMQEYFNYKESYTEADLVDWNNCRDYITSHYTGGNPLEFISLFHAPKRSDATTVFNRTVAGNNLILQKTISQDMLANGIAVYRALSTDLDNLGDQGHLSPDGTHTQEGLPCLLQTYVTACWIFEKLGIVKSVYGCPLRMTTAIYNTLNVPGANLGTGVITGTDAQNILAQEVAIKAYKEGKYYVENNLFSAE